MTSSTGPGPRILGSLRSADGKGIERIEDRFGTDIDDLSSRWRRADRLARWYGQVEGNLRLGGNCARVFASGSGRHRARGRISATAAAGDEQGGRRRRRSSRPRYR